MRAPVGNILGIVGAAIVVVVVVVLAVVQPWNNGADDAPNASGGPAMSAIADDTYILNDAGPGAPVVVEFLDFECPACGTVYPTMEELRERYDGQVTFAVRHFPLSMHPNAMDASLAADAAAQQGEFEAMYQALYENQAEWSGQSNATDFFRSYAEEIGLDLDAYDAAIAADSTRERVESDMEAGVALGVNSTPTIFVNDEPLQLQMLSDIEAGIQEALAAS